MSGATTAREALLAQLLEDVDPLLKRLETLDAQLSARVEEAVKHAAGQAFLAARMNFESMVSEQSGRLDEAGRHAAAQIGNQLNNGAVRLVAATDVLERGARRILLLALACALPIGIIGGFIGAKLAAL